MASILIDDMVAIDAGGLASSLSLRDQARLKALLITHQHYDHVKDLPGLAMSLWERRASIGVYSTRPVYLALRTYFFDGHLYPDFLEPRDGIRVIDFSVIEPHRREEIEGYAVEAIPMAHPVPAVGFQVTDRSGQAVFYTGDTGPGLYEAWRHVSPHLLIVEVTLSNRHADRARQQQHLCPELLKEELVTFRKLKGYLPRVVAVHMNPFLEKEIVPELVSVAADLNADIGVAREGLEILLQSV